MQKVKYFRNKVEIKNIEPDSLWLLENGFFILVNDDDFIAVEASIHPNDFYEAEL